MKHILLALCIALSPLSASADIFIWKDDDSQVKASFPDTWKMINNQQPDTILTVIAPDVEAQPICRIKVREDNRFRMYPRQFESAVQRVAYSQDFWDKYLGVLYEDVRMPQQFDHSGLGDSFASHALFNYTGESQEGEDFHQGIGFASHYFDFAVIAECTAVAGAETYSEWVPQFLSFFGSIDYPPTYGTSVNGKYRNFIDKDARIE